jgi:hypothetical protein
MDGKYRLFLAALELCGDWNECTDNETNVERQSNSVRLNLMVDWMAAGRVLYKAVDQEVYTKL